MEWGAARPVVAACAFGTRKAIGCPHLACAEARPVEGSNCFSFTDQKECSLLTGTVPREQLDG